MKWPRLYYVTVPPLSAEELLDEGDGWERVDWQRVPGNASLAVAVPMAGVRTRIAVPESGGAQRPLQLEVHARPYDVTQPDDTKRSLRVLTLMVGNRRSSVHRRYQDVTYAFQVRPAVCRGSGLHPRTNMRGFGSKDIDKAIADLHYREQQAQRTA